MPRQGYGPVTRSSSALGASELHGGFTAKNRAASGKRKEEESKVGFGNMARQCAWLCVLLITKLERVRSRLPLHYRMEQLARSVTLARLYPGRRRDQER
jgi:hypothetical protein